MDGLNLKLNNMEINKLISMVDFVLQCDGNKETINEENEYFSTTVSNYANFLKQPLTLGMFVPVDEDGNVLLGKPLSPAKDSEWIRWENEEFEFYKAKEKVLFEGFKICDRRDNTCVMTNEYHLNGFMWKDKTVEMLCSYNVTLTEKAIKMIYGN